MKMIKEKTDSRRRFLTSSNLQWPEKRNDISSRAIANVNLKAEIKNL